jgi:hypothetical protein
MLEELKWFKDKVTLMEEEYPNRVEAIEKAMLYTHPRFFLKTLHNELLNGTSNYTPPNSEPNYEYIKGYLHREISEK